ncbi:MAG: hypothetical protein JXB34_13920 [Bacteroidales bacterium]|nr:hypothetical protein [Bacteroidales bacterium]
MAVELYIDNKLTASEKKKVLHHARNCLLCANALEGSAFFVSSARYAHTLENMHNSPWRQSLKSSGSSQKLFVGLWSAVASFALLFGLYYLVKTKEVVEHKTLISPVISYIPNRSGDTIISEYIGIETEVPNVPEYETRQSGNVVPSPPVTENVEVLVSGDSEIIFEETDIKYEKSEIVKMPEVPISEPVNKNKSVPGADIDLSLNDSDETSHNGTKIKASRKRLLTEKKEDKAYASSYYVAEVMPMFKGGGLDTFNKYIADTLKVLLPDSVWHQSIIVSFRISSSGKIDNVKLLSGTASKELNNTITTLIENSPDWVPASICGAPVPVDEQIEIVLNSTR